MDYNKVCVVGLGYIGLPTAALLADRGINVLGFDINEKTVNTINSGSIHIKETELDEIVARVVKNHKLKAYSSPQEADVFIIAVPTPIKENKKPDLSYVESSIQAISSVIKKGDLVILESTSPVGTTEKVAEILSGLRSDLTIGVEGQTNPDVSIAYCPERVLPGQILKELISNDRVVGGLSEKCAQKAVEFYKIFVEGSIQTTSARTAEMVKLTENSFRDVNIAFANELSMICNNLDINVQELISLANRHPRVNILQPGPGVGGHCIAVDPWFIVDSAPEQARIIKMARNVNDYKPTWVFEKFKECYEEVSKTKDKKDIVVSCLGITFKPDVDDLRESPALLIAENISSFHKGITFIVEPNLSHLPKQLQYRNCELVGLKKAFEESDILVSLVKHRCFANIKTVGRRNAPITLDAANIFNAI